MKIYKRTNEVKFKNPKLLTIIFGLFILILSFSKNSIAQDKNQMVRLAKIKVDPLQLDNYNSELKKQMTTAIRLEPGVLTYYAVADKSNPSQITILEIYADTAAYQSHITTSHFKEYKQNVKNMVLSLELIDVNLIASAKKNDL